MAEGFVTGKLIPTVEKGAEMSKVEYYQTERTSRSLQGEIKAIEKESLKIGNITRKEIAEAREFDGFTIPSGTGKWKKGLEDGSLTPKMLDQYLYIKFMVMLLQGIRISLKEMIVPLIYKYFLKRVINYHNHFLEELLLIRSI